MTFLRRSGGWPLWISAMETGVGWEGRRQPNWIERYSPIFPDVETIWDWGEFDAFLPCLIASYFSGIWYPTLPSQQEHGLTPSKFLLLNLGAKKLGKKVFIKEPGVTKSLFRNEIFALFNYIPDQSVVFWRGVQNLNTTKLTKYLSEKGTTNICEVRRTFKRTFYFVGIVLFRVLTLF